MKVSINKNIIKLEHKLKSDELYKLKKTNNIQSLSIYKKPQICNGYSSKCEDGRHIVMLDWDDVSFDVVEEDIKSIQELFNLPTAYVFYTRRYYQDGQLFGSFHAVMLSKFQIKDIMEILGYTHIDENFKTSPARNSYRTWILRLSKKKNRSQPKFLKIIKGEDIFREISTAHKVLLSKFYKKIVHPKYGNEDNAKLIKLQTYETFK